ncbi:hypothetical protein Avbf_18056 [Armadillidium vulgare]|nr:hypothetical protein Avbf_18056 [Armadillidium vulgare]
MVTIQTPWSKVFCFSGEGSCLFSSLLATKNDTEESDLLSCYLIPNRIPPRPELVAERFFLTKQLTYDGARDYCFNNGGEPFIPMTKEEHDYYTSEVMSRSSTSFCWYPVNDKVKEGDVRYDDGTEYGAMGAFTPKPNPGYPNSGNKDCAGVNKDGLVGWGNCVDYEFFMLCVSN